MSCVIFDKFERTAVLASGVTNTPDAVFKAVVRGSGEDKVGPAELLDVAQSLELGCVDDLDEKRV